MKENINRDLVIEEHYLYYSDWVLHGVLSSKHVDPLVRSSHCRVQHSLRHGRHSLPLVEHTVVPDSIMERCVVISHVCVFSSVCVVGFCQDRLLCDDNYGPTHLSALSVSRLSGPRPPKTKMKWR